MQTERRTLSTDALKNLQAYLNTGLTGFYQKALDRIRELGINIENHRTANRVNAENLVDHLHLWA